jgi:inhibitor of KinA sporulation pathway (predicted exonuclease)
MTTLLDPSAPGSLVFYDLEFTAWPGSQARDWSEDWEFREVIQIGAVRVRNTEGLPEEDRLLCHVSPIRNPTLSDYIIDLTGIEQRVIDSEGFGFDEALAVFEAFCDGAHAVLSYGHDYDIIAENCALNGLPPPDLSRFDDVTGAFPESVRARLASLSSHELPTLVGLEPTGRAHDAMDDALSVALTVRELRSRGMI